MDITNISTPPHLKPCDYISEVYVHRINDALKALKEAYRNAFAAKRVCDVCGLPDTDSWYGDIQRRLVDAISTYDSLHTEYNAYISANRSELGYPHSHIRENGLILVQKS